MILDFYSSQVSMLVNLVPLIQIVFTVLLFNKIGIEWWKGIIPIYNFYTISEIGDKKKYFTLYIMSFVIYFVAFFIFFIFILMLAFKDSAASAMLMILLALFFIVLTVVFIVAQLYSKYKIYDGLTKKFNQPTWFSIGMLLIPVVFLGILALDDTKQFDEFKKS